MIPSPLTQGITGTQGTCENLKEKIESIWQYPPEAAKKGLYGDLRINFTIKKDGRLGSVELVRTSGYKMLDDAALKALRDGEHYWPSLAATLCA